MPGGLIGESKAIAEMLVTADRVAERLHSVLVVGETGTGKELVARRIAEKSHRHPFIPVNCALFQPQLAASELFGYVKGSHSAAMSNRPGCWQAANKGTLFLDELAELDLNVQAAVLRALQEGKVRPVGGHSEQSVDVRVIAALSLDPERLVQQGKLRRDLYERFMVHINVPPLRDRGNDVLLIANAFLPDVAAAYGSNLVRFSEDARNALKTYPFPGNVRELQRRVITAVATARADATDVQAADLGLSSPHDDYHANGANVGSATRAHAPISKSARENLRHNELKDLFELSKDQILGYVEKRYVGKGQPRAWLRRWREARHLTGSGQFKQDEVAQLAADIVELMDIGEGRADLALVALLKDIGAIDEAGAKDLLGKLPRRTTEPAAAPSSHSLPPKSGALAKDMATGELCRQISECIRDLRNRNHPTSEQAIALFERCLQVFEPQLAARENDA